MNKKNIIELLQERELISQITDKKKIIDQLSSKLISVYCGFDPTADSLHLGHLIPLLCLKHFQIAGHRPIILIGGATGLIGDPSFKATERKLNSIETIQIWTEKIKKQISLFLNFNYDKNGACIVNNYDWFNSMNTLTFLRDIGKFFSINKMINKESIKQRLHRYHSGISFTEFTYNLLQAYDFAYLNQKYNVTLQIGGSDQWGNIVSGIDLTKRMYKNTVQGFTMPLITNSNNTKFGKTENDVIWLNANKTSPFKFYQFWINTSDKDVYRFLKFFTFLDIEIIHKLELKNHNNYKTTKYAQILLANELTRTVHGTTGLATAQRITANLFMEPLPKLQEEDFIQLVQNDSIPTVYLNTFTSLQHALVLAQLASSKQQARTLIKAHAITINGKKQIETRYIFNNSDKLYGHYTLLRKGKKYYSLIYWT
ncbi:tyrosine--tRNA ligase [Blochmannia endosymbiont of Camponotus (Colobopsis) obliquus]|uniref:tyrosine--tRNA ligase n=1 Tax=Blochmannia endosymbiont of Camponotus (Colobopsis) obliquus TaxID=1505597 RepID=UPI00061A5531|nr:tyrosine--tRNA ligase [Blochmannia endosymbiont of Camponotus (Colobopsis) obliquus]AKC60530.1 tyrosine--tRNA ligase [Blochmannia endosymbiont of Camponotus (Colobopsis) obliquus]